jgi:hypothetical protein
MLISPLLPRSLYKLWEAQCDRGRAALQRRVRILGGAALQRCDSRPLDRGLQPPRSPPFPSPEFERTTRPPHSSPAGTPDNSPGRKSGVSRKERNQVPSGTPKKDRVERTLLSVAFDFDLAVAPAFILQTMGSTMRPWKSGASAPRQDFGWRSASALRSRPLDRGLQPPRNPLAAAQ